MLAVLKTLFAPPTMDSVEDTRTARRFHAVVILGFVLSLVLALLSYIAAGYLTETTVYAGMVAVDLVVVGFVLHLRRLRAAFLTAFIPANLVLALAMWTSQGVLNPVFSIVLTQLTVISVFLGSRVLNLFAGVWGIYLFFLFWAERTGWIAGRYSPDLPLDELLVPIIGLILTTVFLNVVLDRIIETNDALARQARFLEARTAALGETNARLHREIADRQTIEKDLRRRETTLRTLSLAARQLLEGDDFENTLQELLAALGGSIDATRGAVYQVTELPDGDFEGAQLAHWASANVDPRLHDVPSVDQFRFRAVGMETWLTAYQKKEVIKVTLPTMTAQERQLLVPLNVRAFLSVPVYVGDLWWGMVNLGDCLRARQWTTFEVETTRILASLIGAALERQEMERALRQHQKLEGVGLLAGGVAHDFNNLLTGVIAQNALALRRLEAGGDPAIHIRKALVSGQRAADLTRQLLAYAGRSRFHIEPVALNRLIEENSALLDTLARDQVQVGLNLAASLPPVMADRGQLQQILMNLVINAVEAMDGRSGLVTISTGPRRFDRNQTMESTFVVRPPQAGDYVCLEVRDAGRGMDKATQERIFDPFFTTKMDGHGLGLSTMLGILRSLRGALQVQSAPEWGTLFRVFLPAGAHDGEKESIDPHPGAAAGAVQQLILIIDDEQAVREAAQDILELAGHEVLVAPDGASGLALFQEHQSRIGLVLLDMKMPGMNGLAVMERLWQLDSGALILLSTGYSEHMLDEASLPRQPAGFLHKPYDGDTLINSVQRVLQQSADQITNGQPGS